ncbi:MAG: polyamine aminopropyltransferase [Gammaproteobacteria bacterium]|nr:MAG: polyamine aminopropyltransferase [Gammaproteobacteria bacterium]
MVNEIKGKLVHRSQSEHGSIEIYDDVINRNLYLGSNARQSSMLLENSVVLVLDYTQALMSYLLFSKKVSSVLIIGLGGGSLVRFIHFHYPDCHIDVVENRDDVIKVALGYFQLPEADTICIHHIDAKDYLSHNSRQYDAIIVDAFDDNGIAPAVISEEFFSLCHERLQPDGVLSMNAWASSKQTYKEVTGNICKAFRSVMRFPLQKHGNVVLLGMKSAYPKKWYKRLRLRASELKVKTGVNFPGFLKEIVKHNTSFLGRVLSR